MKITKEINAGRRANLWRELKEAFPGTPDHKLLQAFLKDLNLSYWKDSEHFYIKGKHFRAPETESVLLRIKGLDIICNVSVNSTESDFSGAVPTSGCIYTASNVYKPFSIWDMRTTLLAICDNSKRLVNEEEL